MSTDENEKYLVPALIRGLKILELFSPTKKELALSEIANNLEINRSSAFRLVQTLEYCGYISRNAQKNYTLNIKALQLGYSVLAHIDITEKAIPIMQELRDQAHTAVHLSVLDSTDIVYVQNIQALGAFTSNINIGTRWPAHATVIGQILLSSLTDNEIINLYKNFNNWEIYSESTPKNIDELLIKIHAARKSEYLTSWRQFNKDMVASAAPVRHPIQRTIPYVLSVSHPAYSLDRTKYEAEVIPHLIEAAKKMSSYIA